jgi:hypothetical protein
MDTVFPQLIASTGPYYVPVIIGLIAVGMYLALYVAIPLFFSMLGLLLVAYVTYQVVLVTKKKDVLFIGVTFAIVYVLYQILFQLASFAINRGTSRKA